MEVREVPREREAPVGNYGQPAYQEGPRKYQYYDDPNDSKTCCSPGLIIIGGIIFLILVVLALLFGLRVI
mgnify:CR=1 FL=1